MEEFPARRRLETDLLRLSSGLDCLVRPCWQGSLLQRLVLVEVVAGKNVAASRGIPGPGCGVALFCRGFDMKPSCCRCFCKRCCAFSSAKLDVEVVALLLGHLGSTVLFFKPMTRNVRFGPLRSGATLSGAIVPVTRLSCSRMTEKWKR